MPRMTGRTALMNARQVALAQAALLGGDGEALIGWMVAKNLGQPMPPLPPSVAEVLRQAAWIDEAGAFTTIGRLVSDSLREYRFWLDRGRTTHGEHHHPLTAKAAYQGRSVLEVGCGFGANLLSLRGIGARLVGLDPVAVYRQMAPILAAREGLEPLEIVDGLGELLPFADAAFDVVLCYSSHQYMDCRRAFREMARVMKPGGQLQLISGQLDQFMAVMHGQRGLGALRHTVEVWLNTRAYQTIGRRVIGSELLGTTAVPIYPEDHHLERWLNDAGLVFRRDLLRRVNTDTYVFADKPGRG
jgi:SAM-dependent methyltransferase